MMGEKNITIGVGEQQVVEVTHSIFIQFSSGKFLFPRLDYDMSRKK
jgi:hypothetical protein